MSVRRYALGVSISAAVAVTGVLWYARVTPYIAAEDAAALVADTWQRQVALFAVGSNTLENTAGLYLPHLSDYLQISGTVTPFRVRSQIRGASYALKRQFLQDDDLSYPHSGATWVWGPMITNDVTVITESPLATETNEHDVIIRYERPDWALTSVTTGALRYAGVVFSNYTLPDPTNALPTYKTICTRDAGTGTGLRLWQWGENPTSQAASPFSTKRKPAASEYLDHPAQTIGYDATDFWAAQGWGTNLYIWPEIENAQILTNMYDEPYESVAYRGWYIETNTLERLRTACGAMSRAVLVASANDRGLFSCTNSTRWAWSDSYTSGDSTSEVYYAEQDAIVRAVAATGGVTTVVGGGVIANFAKGTELAWAEHDGRGDLKFGTPDLWNVFTSWQARSAHFSGVSCAWPSAAVYASGLVSRVRVYGVFRGRAGVDPIFPESELYSAYTGDATDTETYQAETFGMDVTLSDYPYKAFGSSSNAVDTGENFSAPPSVWRLTKLADVGDPTAAPLFDLGLPRVDLEALGVLQSTDYTYAGSSDDVIGSKYKYEQAVYLIAVIVVADFNFSNYLEPDSPAEAHTPTWLE